VSGAVRRIVYLNPFPTAQITGGIKMAFRHVELLRAMGIDATVYSPKGVPAWFQTDAALVSTQNPLWDSGNLVVFPEVLNGPLAQAAQAPITAAKALLCQNQYFAFSELIPKFTYQQLNFVKLMTVSEIAKGFLERVFAPARFTVLPVWVDDRLFVARDKELRIAVVPRKLQGHYELIRQIFVTKYPRLRHIPWDIIIDKPEAEVAETLGRAAIFLSLSHMESVGLVPLEAMASGCVVIGFHGHGGLEYATEANGIWTRPDDLEATADALAQAVIGIDAAETRWRDLRSAGTATAARFSKEALAQALRATFTGDET
jgi:glycosyltransferase involved in cell wall biosynthesis